jgi:hypothetical protein
VRLNKILENLQQENLEIFKSDKSSNMLLNKS